MPQNVPSIEPKTEREPRRVLVTSCGDLPLPQTPGVEEARNQLAHVIEAVDAVTYSRRYHWLKIIGEATSAPDAAKDPALDISRINMVEEYKRALKIPKTEQVELFVEDPEKTQENLEVRFGLRTPEIQALAIWRLRLDAPAPEKFEIALENVNLCRSDLLAKSVAR